MTSVTPRRAGLLVAVSLAACGIALSGTLGAQGQGTPQGPDPDRFIVKFTDTARGRAAVAAAGGQVLLDLPEQAAAAARLPAQARQALLNNPNIEYIEPDVPRYPFAETTPYGIAMVQANQVSDAKAVSRKVCIIDSGYASGHEDLPVASGTSVSGTGSWFTDGCGHGTHVAGTIAAMGGNNLGVVGVLPGSQIGIHVIKVFGSNCSWAYSSTLISAANLCRDAGAHVINMSLGGGGSSTTEASAFQNLYNQGILSIAAAGNNGTTQHSYPASYASVVSVAAVDSAKVAASFSQRNGQVELSAPGVAVRSTVAMGAGKEESLQVGGSGYEVVAMAGSPNLSRSGQLFNCGLATSTCTGATGRVCLIQRGSNSFAEKVVNCQNGGGVGAVIYNNADPLFSGTLGNTSTSIPSVGASGTTGAALLNLLGQNATVTVGTGNYAYYDGTSMATPHVAGVAALIWSENPGWTNQQIRDALAATAEDRGAAGRDNTYGWGIIRAKAALDHLLGTGGGNPEPPPPPPPPTFTLSVTKSKLKGVNVANLSWGGTSATSIDVFRNEARIATVNNSGAYTDSGMANKSTHTYKVCNAGSTTTCSNSVTITF